MKKFKFNNTFLITLLTFFTLFSCNKDDDTNQEEEPQQASCLINTIYNNYGVLIHEFTYDESAKIIKAIAGGNTLNYTYSGNSIIIEEETPSGKFAGKATYLLNAKGFVTYVHAEHNEAGTNWSDNHYVYENDSLLVKYIGTNSTGSQPFVQTYTWQNGNIIASETGTGKITTYTYYLDMPKKYGGYYSYINLISGGAKIIENKNELKSYSLNGITTTFSYQTDDDGKIMVMMQNYGTTAISISYGYQCD